MPRVQCDPQPALLFARALPIGLDREPIERESHRLEIQPAAGPHVAAIAAFAAIVAKLGIHAAFSNWRRGRIGLKMESGFIVRSRCEPGRNAGTCGAESLRREVGHATESATLADSDPTR